MNYNAEPILHLARLIQGNAASHAWLHKNNFPELILLHFAIEGNDQAMRELIRNKQVELAAFAQAILDDKQAFNSLVKNKKIIWAATAKVAYKDRKAEAWLLRYNLPHYAELGRAIRKNLEDQSGGDILGMMKKLIKVLKNPFGR